MTDIGQHLNGWYCILGINPVPWTAPNVAVIRPKKGKAFPKVYAASELKTYKEAIRDEFAKLDLTPVEAPIALSFYFFRKLEHLERPEGRSSHGKPADATNLQKALEDGLQGVLFKNDRQVQEVHSHIVEQSADTEPKILIHITTDFKLPLGWAPNIGDPDVTVLEQDKPFEENVRDDVDMEDVF